MNAFISNLNVCKLPPDGIILFEVDSSFVIIIKLFRKTL